MTTIAAQAAAFYEEASRDGAVWAIRDEGGYPAPLNGSDVRAMPFWSLRSRAELVITNVPAYDGFIVEEIPLSGFLDRWLPGLERDGLVVGLNWSGIGATGYDVPPADVEAGLGA